jgi:hypothetical protein
MVVRSRKCNKRIATIDDIQHSPGVRMRAHTETDKPNARGLVLKIWIQFQANATLIRRKAGQMDETSPYWSDVLLRTV